MNQLSTFSPFGEAFSQSFVENPKSITEVALWVILSYSVIKKITLLNPS